MPGRMGTGAAKSGRVRIKEETEMGKNETAGLTREQRIGKEERRLLRLFREMEETRKKTVLGLIRRAAFMRISLEDLEEYLNENGFTEMFSQSEKQEPYLRERPEAKIYATLNAGYQKIMKQLTDLLPKEDPRDKGGDAFNDF